VRVVDCEGRLVPPRIASSVGHREEGTASVELIAVTPFLLLAVVVAAQIAVVGQAIWSAGLAARSAARVAVVAEDPKPAARRALPPSLWSRTVREGHTVTVDVAVPRLIPILPKITVQAGSALDDG
jgi:hypothetical protein